MIDILDKKGSPLGLDHDYEYRGAMREGNRDAPMKRANAIWMVFAILFALPGVILIVKSLEGTLSGTLGGFVIGLLFSFGLAAIFLWLRIKSKRKHRELLEKIGKL